MNYQEYLKSEHWKLLRSKKYRSAKPKCAICGTDNTQLDVHHINYKNLLDVDTSDLRILCHGCHFLVHDLMRNGKIRFKRNGGHNYKFAVIKSRVLFYLYGKKKTKRKKLINGITIKNIPASTDLIDRILIVDFMSSKRKEIRKHKYL